VIVYVLTRSAGSFGGNTIFSLVGEYLESGLGDYGSAIRQLEVTVCFRGGRVRNPSLQRSFDVFHSEFLPNLPLVKFLRKRNRIDIRYETTVADATFLERYGFLSPELFNAALHEVAEKLHLMDPRLKATDDFDRTRFFNDLNCLVSQSPTHDPDLKALKIKVEQQKKARLAAMDPWERLDIDWDEYHPAARKLLNDPFFWSATDDSAPHGNDTGADLLADFKKRNRLHSDEPAHAMATALLRSWDIHPFDHSAIDEGQVKALVTNDPIALDVTDQALIAAAFAVIKLRGCCDRRTREFALAAIVRERLVVATNAEHWKYATERLQTPDRLEGALLNSPEAGE
jgi:uncharacterized protein YfeS